MGSSYSEVGTYDLIGLLNGHRSCDVASNLETSSDEDNDEILSLVFEDCLVELDCHWNGVQDCEDDGEG